MEYLNEDAYKKKEQKWCFLYIWGSAILIATGFNLRDTKYEFYGFTDDLRDIIPLTNEYHCHKAAFCKNKCRLCCYL